MVLKRLKTFVFEHRNFLFLYLIILIAYFSVAALIHPLKYDFFDEFYPKRYFIFHNLHNGILPMWCPYQHAGFPIYADPSSAFFYPLTWIIGLFHVYTIQVGNLEFVLHLFIAATGFYKFSGLYIRNNYTLTIVSLGYALGGFFTGNAQHYPWIISAAWMPFVFYGIIQTINTQNIKYTLQTSLYVTLFLTGGYPAFLIISLYLIVIYIILKFIDHFRKNEINKLKKISVQLFILTFISSILCLGYLMAVYNTAPLISRGDHITILTAMEHPFSPKALISLILPFTTVVRPLENFGADMSVSNAYMGGLVLIFLIISLIHLKQNKIRILLIITLIFLFISFGEGFLLRKLLYEYVPLMNMFRFPSIFRIFFISSSLLLAGIILDKYFTQTTLFHKIRFIPLFFSGILMVISIIIYVKNPFNILQFVRHELFHGSSDHLFSKHLLVQACIQSAIFICLYFAIFQYYNHHSFKKILIIIVSFDLIFSVWLNAPFTIFYRNHTIKEVKLTEQLFPKNYPNPSIKNVIETSSKNFGKSPYWQNLPTFYKQVSHEGRNPFKLKRFDELKTKHRTLYDSTLNNPVIFSSNAIYPLDSIENHLIANKLKRTFIYLDTANSKFRDVTDSLTQHSLQIQTFLPTKFVVSVETKQPTYIMFLQSYHKGWKATINDQKAEILNANIAFMAVKIPKGHSVIQLSFHQPIEKTALFISLIAFSIIVSVIIFLRFKKTKVISKAFYLK